MDWKASPNLLHSTLFKYEMHLDISIFPIKVVRFQKSPSVNHVSQNKMLYCFWPVQGIYKYKKTWRQDELNFNSKSNSNCNSDYKANDDFEENPDKIWALIGSANIKGWKD